MRKIDVGIRREIERRDDEWVKRAEDLALMLVGTLVKGKERPESKERQLRNIQAIAEQSNSWKALELFMRYQAARNQIPKEWVESAIPVLEKLEGDAKDLVSDCSDKDDIRKVHMELVSRVIGYLVRCHVWDIKGKEAGAS